MINEILKKFDEKYGYEYPRCALIMKNIEVRDENEDLVGHTSTAAVTPEEIKSFITTQITELLQSLISDLEKETDIDEEISATKDVTLQWANGWNQALNLAQERIKELIK